LCAISVQREIAVAEKTKAMMTTKTRVRKNERRRERRELRW
jgi:hypothetical protein